MSQTVRPLPGQPRAAPFDAYDPSARVFTLGENEPGGWDILRQLWRRKLLITGVTILMAGVGIAAVTLMSPRYTAEARVLLGVQDRKVTNVQSVLEGLVPNDSNIRSEAFLISSRSMARQVGYRLALDKSPAFNPFLAPEPTWTDKLHPGYMIGIAKDWALEQKNALFGDETTDSKPADEKNEAAARQAYMWKTIENKLLYRVEATPLNRSHVVSITAEFDDPTLSAEVANAFSRVYVESQRIEKQKAADQANTWLDTQIKDLQAKVIDAERNVETYRREHDLYSTKSDTVIGQQLAALNQELIAAERSKVQAESKLDQAQSLTGRNSGFDNLPAVLQSPLIVNLRGRQAGLEGEAADLSAKYTSKHPEMRNIRAQISDINGKIEAEIDRIVGSLENEVRIATNQYESIRTRLAELKANMGSSNTEQIELRQLEREAEASRNMLESLLQRSKETANQSDLSRANAEIISMAAPPNGPSFPPSTLIVLVSVLAGFGTGVLIALLLERLDQTFRTTDEIEEITGLPALAVIPSIKKTWAQRMDHVVRQPNSTYTNAVRSLAAHLAFSNSKGHLSRVVMFTSAVPGEGKSHTSCSYAQLLANDAISVILVDADWRQPTQHTNFGQRRRSGVLDLLQGKARLEDVVYRDAKSGVDVLFAGKSQDANSLSVSLTRFQQLINGLTMKYDIVVLDTSPLAVTPEMLHLARAADCVVFNVKWGSTPRRVVTNELKHLMRTGANVEGIALSQVNLNKYDQYSYDDGGYLPQRYLVQDMRLPT